VAALYAEWGVQVLDAASSVRGEELSPSLSRRRQQELPGATKRTETSPLGLGRAEVSPSAADAEVVLHKRELRPACIECAPLPDFPATLSQFEAAYADAEKTAGSHGFRAGLAATQSNNHIVLVHDL